MLTKNDLSKVNKLKNTSSLNENAQVLLFLNEVSKIEKILLNEAESKQAKKVKAAERIMNKARKFAKVSKILDDAIKEIKSYLLLWVAGKKGFARRITPFMKSPIEASGMVISFLEELGIEIARVVRLIRSAGTEGDETEYQRKPGSGSKDQTFEEWIDDQNLMSGSTKFTGEHFKKIVNKSMTGKYKGVGILRSLKGKGNELGDSFLQAKMSEINKYIEATISVQASA